MQRVDLTFRNYKHADFYLEQVPLSVSIGQVKSKLSELYPDQPASARQRLIFMGKILSDENATLSQVFSHLSPTQLDSSQSIHLVIAPPSSSQTQPQQAQPPQHHAPPPYAHMPPQHQPPPLHAHPLPADLDAHGVPPLKYCVC
jgi:hypothetical protein